MDAYTTSADQSPNAIVLFSGVVIAFGSIIASSLSQWRNLRIQQTFLALQTLRTDREYLINALKVEESITALGLELTDAEIARFHAPASESSVDNPSFSQASRFLLNQYEFIAAACRRGLMDEKLLRETVKNGFCNVVRTYRPLIKERRDGRPESLANLVWLYRRFEDGSPIDLGPAVPRLSPGGLTAVKHALGVIPHSKRL